MKLGDKPFPIQRAPVQSLLSSRRARKCFLKCKSHSQSAHTLLSEVGSTEGSFECSEGH